MALVVNLGQVLKNQTTKRDAIIALTKALTITEVVDGRAVSFDEIFLDIAKKGKVPADLLLSQALGILFLETGYLTSGQWKACNQGGMTSSAEAWIGSSSVRADSTTSIKNIPSKYQPYFDVSADTVPVEILESWFKRDGNGRFKTYQPAVIKYPVMQEPWMGVIVKALYLITEKSTINAAVKAVAPGYQAKLWRAYEANGVSPAYRKGVERLALNTLIYNSPGKGKKTDAAWRASAQSYVDLVEDVKKKFTVVIY